MNPVIGRRSAEVTMSVGLIWSSRRSGGYVADGKTTVACLCLETPRLPLNSIVDGVQQDVVLMQAMQRNLDQGSELLRMEIRGCWRLD